MTRPRLMSILVTGVLLCVPAVTVAQSTLKEFNLKDGLNDENEVKTPIYDATRMASLYIGSIDRQYDVSALVFRKASKGSAWTGSGPEYYIDKTLDLAASLKDVLTSQGKAMGFSMASSPDSAWALTGALKEIVIETEQTAGATLFNAMLQVELQLRNPDGATTNHALALYNYSAVRRKGFRRQGRAEEALAITLHSSAHEILAHLNVAAFKAPAHPGMAALARDLAGATQNDIYRLGLTGSSDLAPRLREALPKREDEDDRMAIIEALGRLRAADAVAELGGRYDDEDEDCRWATLKAMAYIGGEAAMQVVKDHGLKDEYTHARRLAERIVERR